MTTENKPTLNQRYTLDELAKCIPDMWAFLSDPEYDEHGWVIAGTLIAYAPFELRESVHRDLNASGITDYVCERTTEAEPFMGVIFL